MIEEKQNRRIATKDESVGRQKKLKNDKIFLDNSKEPCDNNVMKNRRTILMLTLIMAGAGLSVTKSALSYDCVINPRPLFYERCYHENFQTNIF